MEILDTTLRDGEQMDNVAFSTDEKIIIAHTLIEALYVDAIEVTSAFMSDEEQYALQKIMQRAEKKGYGHRVEALGFVDGRLSVDWIAETGCKVMNLLAKGSKLQLQGQLGKDIEQHAKDISEVVHHAEKRGVQVNIYLEDWSRGIQSSPGYVYHLLDHLRYLPVGRVMLADTLGVLDPWMTHTYVSAMLKSYHGMTFDFHGHNDYGMAVANSLAAAKAGASRIHTTVNGLGERAGNTELATLVASLKDHMHEDVWVEEAALMHVSELVAAYAQSPVAPTAPVIGKNAFTQNCGVHADGDGKGALYQTDLNASRFGRARIYSLGKTAGRASIIMNLCQQGLKTDPLVTAYLLRLVKERGAAKMPMTPEELAEVARTDSHKAYEAAPLREVS
jgi:D-citramalate synthase